jgi:phenylpropionate dioxygenase-like ring-hydroxylating dioxygenase large terminal subunit
MEKGVLPPATASCVKSYPTVVKQGLIWVWTHPGVSPNPDEISTFDPIDQPGVIHVDFQRYCISLIVCSSCFR